MRFFTQGRIDGLDKTTEAGFAEALLIAMSNLKNEQGLLLNVRLSDDFNQQIDFAKQIARMMVKEQPEQKPVAWGVFDGPNLHDVDFTEEEAHEMVRLKGDGSVVKPLYTSTQPQMQPCAGRNCGSTNPNLHSAECFEDYEKSTGMAQPVAPKCGAIIEVFGKDWRIDYMSLPVGKHKLYTQQYTYIAPLAEQEFVAHAVIAGALFDFMGWLTSRKERLVLSSADEASPAVDAIRDFAKIRGLSLDDAKVQDWNTTPPQCRPLTVHEIAEFVGTKEYGSEQLKWFRFGEAAHGVKENT